MSKRVYCYYEGPVAEQGSQNRMSDDYARQQASCREFAEKMGWDIVGVLQKSQALKWKKSEKF